MVFKPECFLRACLCLMLLEISVLSCNFVLCIIASHPQYLQQNLWFLSNKKHSAWLSLQLYKGGNYLIFPPIPCLFQCISKPLYTKISWPGISLTLRHKITLELQEQLSFFSLFCRRWFSCKYSPNHDTDAVSQIYRCWFRSVLQKSRLGPD